MKKYNIDGLPGLTMQGKKGPNGKRGCRTFCNVQNSYKLDLEYQYSVGVYSETGDIVAIPIPSYGITPIIGDYVINVTNSKSYLYSVINIIPIEKSALKNASSEEDIAPSDDSSDDSSTGSLSFNDEVIALLKTIDGVNEITTGEDPYYYVFELSLLDTWSFKSGVVFDSDLNVLVKSTKLRRTPWYGYYKPMYIKSETTFESFPGNRFSYVDKNGKILVEDPSDKAKTLTPDNGYKCLFNFYRDILGYGVDEYGWLQTTPGEISPIVNLPLKEYDNAPLDVFKNSENYIAELEKGKDPDENDLSVVNEVSENYAVQCLKLKIIDSLTGEPFKSYLEEVAEGEEQPNLEYDIEVSIVFGDEYYVDFGNSGDSNETNSQQKPEVTYNDNFKETSEHPDKDKITNKETLWSIVDKGSTSQKGYCLNLTNRLVSYTCKRRQPSTTPPHEDPLDNIYEKRTFDVTFKVKVNRNSNIKKGDKDRVYRFEVIYFKPAEPDTVITLAVKDESNLDDAAVNPLDNYTTFNLSSIDTDTIFQIKYYTKYIEDVDDPEAEYIVVEHIIEKTAEDIIAGMSTYDDTTDRIDIQEVISDEEYLRSISNTILSAGSLSANDGEETSSDIEISKLITSEIRYVKNASASEENAPIHVDSTGCASIPLVYFNGSMNNDYSNTIAYIAIKPYIATVAEDKNIKPTWTDSLFFPATILFNNKNVTVDNGGIIEVECRVLKRSFMDDERVKKLGAVVGPTIINEKDVYFEQSNYFWSEDTVGDAKLRYEEGTYGYNNQFATQISEDPFNAMFKVESDKLLFYSSVNPAVNKSKLQPISWLKAKLGGNNEEDTSLNHEDNSMSEDMYADYDGMIDTDNMDTDSLITADDIDSYNEDGRNIEYTDYALTQFVISTTLSSDDLKNIKIVAELYNNDKEHIKSVSSCMDKMWDTELYNNDKDGVNNTETTRKDILRDGLDKFILIQRSTPTSTKFYNRNVLNPHYFEVASYNDFENCYEYDDTGKIVGMSDKYNKYGMYNHLGHSKNFTSALNFDDENIFPCTVLLKDYNTMNDPGDNISTIMIPSELFNKCTMSIYAYCKTSSTAASKILLGTTSGNETY